MDAWLRNGGIFGSRKDGRVRARGAKRERGRIFGGYCIEWRFLVVENVDVVLLFGGWFFGVVAFGGGECRYGYCIWGILLLGGCF